MIISIFTYLKPSELSHAATICRRWKFLATDRILWRRLSFAKNSKITSTSISMLLNRFGDGLTDMELCECKGVSKPMLLEMAPNLKRLESLHLCQLKVVDDSILEIGRAVQQECRDRSRMPSSA
eukprot:TRINITY_DN22183_c0_g1_i8.p1 TRINITY_DN22183_c0_g1~~TRINITY_DN22183_c0_g1_i8.p1  ORF type:complete len:124 (+),score=6.79 TRINITY_DN22183_c0_g1_i8:102-473(+)